MSLLLFSAAEPANNSDQRFFYIRSRYIESISSRDRSKIVPDSNQVASEKASNYKYLIGFATS